MENPFFDFVDNHWPTAGLWVNSTFLKAGFGSNLLFLLEGITLLPSTPSAGCANQKSYWAEIEIMFTSPHLTHVKCHKVVTLVGGGSGIKGVYRFFLYIYLKKKCFGPFFWVWTFLFLFLLLSWWPSLLCIVRELFGFFLALAVGDRWQVTVTCDRWHIIITFYLFVHIERLSISLTYSVCTYDCAPSTFR